MKSIRLLAFIVVFVLGLVVLAGCKRDNGEGKTEGGNDSVSIRVTESKYILYTIIKYCGMPNESSFSLSDSSNWSVNFYYTKDSKQIYFKGKIYEVVSVDANQITLRWVKVG
jgi:hypothetical protein